MAGRQGVQQGTLLHTAAGATSWSMCMQTRQAVEHARASSSWMLWTTLLLCRGRKSRGKQLEDLPHADSLASVELSILPEPASRLGTDESEAGLLPQNGNAHVAIDMPGALPACCFWATSCWSRVYSALCIC